MVVNRFRVDDVDESTFRADLDTAHAVLAERPGYVEGRIGRSVDEPQLWVLVTTWANVGSYRRALSAYDVRVTAVPLLSRAIDEPSAYESVAPGAPTNTQSPRELD
jgi:quinol monooxygenase YgiN